MQPLEGVRIIDLSGLAPGPFCSMVLSDLGADVTLIEAPPETRNTGPFDPNKDPVREAAFDPFRRNKRSIVLNLKQPSAQEVVHRMAKQADVFMEGFRPGVTARLGVDYATLRKHNKGIIYCSLTGFGQDGPYKMLPGHDINYLAIAGALSVIGGPEGKPVAPYNIIADFAGGGLFSAVAILSALWARQKTGEGQQIDISLTDNSAYLMAQPAYDHFSHGTQIRPGRMRLNGGFPDYDTFICKDGKYLSVGCLEVKFWENLCRALGKEEFIAARPPGDKPEEGSHIRAELTRIFLTRTRDEWFAYLFDKDVAVAKVNQVEEMANDAHLQARKMIVDVPGPRGQTYRQVGIGPRLSATPGKIRSAGVPPGASTREVLAELGYSTSDAAALLASGAAVQG
ncbi:MAG: CoA transferase [Chloroflexi bacterium]|nr:CoA transferase [Chloroflexota bacterium]